MKLGKILLKSQCFFFFLSFLLFFASRIFVLINHPNVFTSSDFSVVKSDYERYANIWWYGIPPYFKHLYEYPPATIPLLITPLALDLWGFGIYYFNYRYQVFFLEFIIYFFLLKGLNKIYPTQFFQKISAVFFYNLAPLIASPFWYDSIDLVFIGSLCLGLISLILVPKPSLKSKILFWSLFWLSVSIKLITLPLLLPFFLINKERFKEEFKALSMGFLIIWGVPLAIFRSSLSVFLYFHTKRPLHSSSFPAYIVYTLNHFTKSEQMINLEWFGKLSQKALIYSSLALIIVTTLAFLWGIKKYISNNKTNRYFLMIRVSLVYLLGFIMAAKIFSPPFNIWYVLLLTILPIQNIKIQSLLYFSALFSLVFNTTNIVKLPETIMIYPFTWQYLRHIFRFVPILLMTYLILNENLGSKKGKLPKRLA